MSSGGMFLPGAAARTSAETAPPVIGGQGAADEVAERVSKHNRRPYPELADDADDVVGEVPWSDTRSPARRTGLCRG